jgi:hypothetical protein
MAIVIEVGDVDSNLVLIDTAFQVGKDLVGGFIFAFTFFYFEDIDRILFL